MEAPSEDRVDELELEGQTDLANEPQSPAAEDENVSPFFMNSESRRLSLTSDVMQEETSTIPARRQYSTASARDLRRQSSNTSSKGSKSKAASPRRPTEQSNILPTVNPAILPSTDEAFLHNQGMRDILSSHSTKQLQSGEVREAFLQDLTLEDEDEAMSISDMDDGGRPAPPPAPRAPSPSLGAMWMGSRATSPVPASALGGLEGISIGGGRPGSSSPWQAPPHRLPSPSSAHGLRTPSFNGLLPPLPTVTLPAAERKSRAPGASPFMERRDKAQSPVVGPWASSPSPSHLGAKEKLSNMAPVVTKSSSTNKPLSSQAPRRLKGGQHQPSTKNVESIKHAEAWSLGEFEEDFKRTMADHGKKGHGGGRGGGGGGGERQSAHRTISSPIILQEKVGESLNGLVLVKSTRREGPVAQVPRQKKQNKPSPAALAKAALRQLSLVEAEPRSKNGLLNRDLIEDGARRRRAAEASHRLGPPKFVRKLAPPHRPPSPSGAVLDGFTLLEAGDEETPDLVMAARLPNRGFTRVEEGDLAYFPLLRALDLSDNKLTDMNCLAPLFGLQVLNLSRNQLACIKSKPAAREEQEGGEGGGGDEEGRGGGGNEDEDDSPLGPWFEELQVLDLSYNFLPSDLVFGSHSKISELPFLRELDLTGNSLSDFPDPIGSFPALRVLRLDGNRIHGAALEALGVLPALSELYLSNNVITGVPEEVTDPGRFPELKFLDLTHNRISDPAIIDTLRLLPRLKELLIHGNPLALKLIAVEKRTGSSSISNQTGLQVHTREVSKLPPKISIASVLSANLYLVDGPIDPRSAANLSIVNAASGANDGAVEEAFDRLDEAMDSWKLGTVAEGEEEEEEGEDEGEEEEEAFDSTFLTGVGIEEKKSKKNKRGPPAVDEMSPEPYQDDMEEEEEEVVSVAKASSKPVDDRPLWADIDDPTERLALALGLDPALLAVNTGRLTSDSVGAVNALRFALSHSLVSADEGLGSPSRLLASTLASRMKRKGATKQSMGAKLAPLHVSPAKATAIVKIETVDGLLSGMKQRLHGLEASLAEKLALVPAPVPKPAPKEAEEDNSGSPRSGDEQEDGLVLAKPQLQELGGRPMSPLGSETRDEIENPDLSDFENGAERDEDQSSEDGEAIERAGVGPGMATFGIGVPPASLKLGLGGTLLGY